MKPDLLSACRAEVLVCDGAMGTQLFERGLKPGDCGMEWNALHPENVLSVHQAYAESGCRLITTNSFGGTRTMLERHGHANQVAPWNRKAAELAREAAGAGGWVLGDVGPFGDFLEPLGDMTEAGLLEIFGEQMQALVDGGADALLVETMSDAAEAVIGIRAAKSVAGLPVVATFAFQKADTQFRTMMGTSVQEVIQTVLSAGADIVGANCGTDLSLEDYVVLAGELKAAAGSVPVILQPNAGSPKQGPAGIHYDATPAEMAATALRLRDAGVAMIGGCCGTSPTHLAAMTKALK